MNAILEYTTNNPKGKADFAAASTAFSQSIAALNLQKASRMLGGVALLLITTAIHYSRVLGMRKVEQFKENE